MSFDEAKQAIDEKLKLGVVGEEESLLLEAYGRILS